jgi:soluble epoxide hydrolase/lipid-phosphate phosphatase
MAVHNPDRVLGVAALNTPFFPPNPSRNPMAAMLEKPGNYDYQLYFMQEA